MNTKPFTLFFVFAVLLFNTICPAVYAESPPEQHKTNLFQQKSLSNHIKHFKDCGFRKGDIEIKRDSDANTSIPLIAYIIKSNSIDLECLLSSKLKAKPIIKKNVPFFFESLFDSGEAESTYPLEEGLIKLNDRILVFTAPDSDKGVVEIKIVSDEYIVVRIGTHTHSRNFLVATDSIKINHLSDGVISVTNQEKLIFKASGRKSYFKDFGGPFWYDALIDKTGKFIDIVSVVDKKNSECYLRSDFFKKSDIEDPGNSSLMNFIASKEICVER